MVQRENAKNLKNSHPSSSTAKLTEIRSRFEECWIGVQIIHLNCFILLEQVSSYSILVT